MSKYGELVNRVLEAIEHGDLQAGDALPSLRQLVSQHGVSLNTARRAYYELERLGFAEARPRSAYVVTQSGSRELRPTVPAGTPFIDPALYDTRPLGRIFFNVMRQYPSLLAEPAASGLPALQRQIARLAHGEGWQLHADEVLITCGGMEALSLAFAAVLHGVAKPRVIVLQPAFPGMLNWLATHGVEVLSWHWPAHGEPDLAELDRLLQQGGAQALALMSVFAHPHGRSLSADLRSGILARAARHDLAIIEDDAYRHLAFDGSTPLPLKAQDSDGRVLLCSTFSKSLTPGYRVGWLAAGRHLPLVCQLKQAQTLASPLPNQMVLAELLAGNRHQALLQHLQTRLQQRMSAWQSLCQPLLQGQERPGGAYFLWLASLPQSAAQLIAGAGRAGIILQDGAICFSEPGARGLRLNASYAIPGKGAAAQRWFEALATATV